GGARARELDMGPTRCGEGEGSAQVRRALELGGSAGDAHRDIVPRSTLRAFVSCMTFSKSVFRWSRVGEVQARSIRGRRCTMRQPRLSDALNIVGPLVASGLAVLALGAGSAAAGTLSSLPKGAEIDVRSCTYGPDETHAGRYSGQNLVDRNAYY